jgi:hypothetical protein
VSPAQVAGEVLGSGEYATRLVQGFYQTFLGRSAAPAELIAAVDGLRAFGRDEDFLAALMASPEYAARN